MSDRTISSQVNNGICEAVGCLAKATTEITVKVGQLGVIPLRLCKGCVDKFNRDEGLK